MNDLVPVWKKRKIGRPSDYDPDVHLDMLYDVFTAGKGIIHFCAKANICKKTFHNWVKKHYLFKQAYHLSLPKGAAKHEDDAEALGKDVNFQSWKFIHMNRFGSLYVEKKVKKPKENTIEAKCEAIWNSYIQGKISAQELNNLVSSLVKLKELEIDKQRLDMERENKVKDEAGKTTDEHLEAYMLLREGKAEIVMKENME